MKNEKQPTRVSLNFRRRIRLELKNEKDVKRKHGKKDERWLLHLTQNTFLFLPIIDRKQKEANTSSSNE